MEISDFKALLTEQELKKYSEKDIERLFAMADRASDIAFKFWFDKRLETFSENT
jgi:hypothetical protein